MSRSPRIYKVPPNILLQPEFPRFEQRPSKTLGLRTQMREEDKVIQEMGRKMRTMEIGNIFMVEDASIAAGSPTKTFNRPSSPNVALPQHPSKRVARAHDPEVTAVATPLHRPTTFPTI